MELEDRVDLMEEVDEVIVKMEDADDWFLESLLLTFDQDGEEVKNLEDEIAVGVNQWFGKPTEGNKNAKTEIKVFEKGEERDMIM